MNQTGFIQTAADATPRPLTEAEAQEVFTNLASMRDRIAFGYLQAGCECRAQLMIERMLGLGINPGRIWALSLGRKLSLVNPRFPRRKITWENHVAPIVVVEGSPPSVLVIDPSLISGGPLSPTEWALAMRVRHIELSTIPLTQAQILDRQTACVLAGDDPLDAILFALARDVAPLPDIGGSGFRLAEDPPEGPSVFAQKQMIGFLRLQDEQ